MITKKTYENWKLRQATGRCNFSEQTLKQMAEYERRETAVRELACELSDAGVFQHWLDPEQYAYDQLMIAVGLDDGA